MGDLIHLIGHRLLSHFRGSDLQNYFQRSLGTYRLKTVLKPQLEMDLSSVSRGKTVRALLEERDERGMMDRYVKIWICAFAGYVEHLSGGGELQRFAVLPPVCRDADVYMFGKSRLFLGCLGLSCK
jgi:translation initiation factor RLI1